MKVFGNNIGREQRTHIGQTHVVQGQKMFTLEVGTPPDETLGGKMGDITMTPHELGWFAAILWREAVKAEPIQPDRVRVRMRGGEVYNVDGIPIDVVIETRDYDINAITAIVEEDSLEKDENGNPYFPDEWRWIAPS